MRPSSKIINRRSAKFFRIALGHNSLENVYLTNFALMQHHNYSLSELEDMMPFEREIYITLLKNWIKEENERIKRENASR